MHVSLLLIVLGAVFSRIQPTEGKLPLGPKPRPNEKKPTYYHYNPKSKINIEKRRKYMNLIAPLDAAILSLRHELRCNFQVFRWTIEIPTWFGKPRTVTSSIHRLQRMRLRLIRTYKLYQVFEQVP